ncbi:HlyD family type I secretion periplasmic adaptor subunit [Phyllobacterium sp. 0TCS1.6C]|uniref:HlyD family type I secretion periplasmic adaptor subunit n=1 Tax=unclassified Phyllobacterium TaxID=2638441 RepID=UPI00226485B8|nr:MULTISPECIES: HlyD family type I secretion periplasmic adaptor subunit [unclassified Phyllobacterium]MCX8279305.1 HlyD family type I secretion periplasmic adaptor subunit [Phyllobacterium sp. 0TCS1.6C]MCX8294089.1 HlyD family type I secretion periplasmic adaptor subunit [Phyllobacterium sp. 0TCS1.6A]
MTSDRPRHVVELLAPRTASTGSSLPTRFGTVRPEWVTDLEQEDEKSPLRRLVIAGITTIGIAFGGFFSWAYSAELGSAAIAIGTVIVDSKRKTISHFEGGILDSLLVREGDVVTAGQPLLRLDNTRARSELRALQSRRVGLIARLARLRAEQATAAKIQFPEEFGAGDDVTARNAMKAEQIFFEKRSFQKISRIDVQRKTIEQHTEQAKASEAQIAAADRQIALITEQRAAVAGLVDKGFAEKSRLTEIDARLSELAGSRGEYAGDKAVAEQAKAGAEFALHGIESDLQSEIAGEITTNQIDLADTEERIVAAKDVLRRVEIASPQAGIVDNIRLRTPGGVVAAGEAILDIVPENEPMIVEMMISPRDIDGVAVDSAVQVRLTAFNQRSLSPLDGKVTYVAADQLINERNDTAYFVARAEISARSLAANPSIRLYPGMPAEILIVHKPRRAIDYLAGPITDTFNRAFRED